MSWSVSTKQYIPAQIGEPWGGGYFAGYISHTANGNPTHALIVAPRATGASGSGYTLTTNYAWKTTQTLTSGTTSTFDGRANTDAMIAAGIDDHPAAKFCVDLNIGGYTDWYLPAPLELEIAYFNLKPDTTLNTTAGNINIYSVPQRNTNYSSTYPSQTPITAFTTNQESFVGNVYSGSHWSSRESTTISSFYVRFDNGRIGGYSFNQGDLPFKTNGGRVRAFRRVSLSGYTTI